MLAKYIGNERMFKDGVVDSWGFFLLSYGKEYNIHIEEQVDDSSVMVYIFNKRGTILWKIIRYDSISDVREVWSIYDDKYDSLISQSLTTFS